MKRCYTLLSLVCFSNLFVFGVSAPALAQADLVIEKTDITIVKSSANNQTYVTVTVHNNGTVGSGTFTLRVGASMGGSSSTDDFAIAGLPAGQAVSKMAHFAGTDWMCGWGNADVGTDVSESDENNNCASENEYWIGIGPGGMHNELIGVVNPGFETETMTITVTVPPEWTVWVDPTEMTLAPEEHRPALVHFEAPEDFRSYVCIDVFCEFQDGTPGIIDWQFHIESTVPVEESTWGRIKALFSE